MFNSSHFQSKIIFEDDDIQYYLVFQTDISKKNLIAMLFQRGNQKDSEIKSIQKESKDIIRN